MNRVRILLLTAYIMLAVVGGAIYVQSVSNMVLFTEADQVFPRSVNLTSVEIPRFSGQNQSYLIKCTFKFDNPTRVTIVLRAFTFVLSIDNGEAGNMFDGDRLQEEWVGQGSTSSGEAGPRIDPGESHDSAFVLRVSASDSLALNHTNAQGKYVAIFYSMVMSYGFVDTPLSRQVVLPDIVQVADPVE